MDVKVCETGCGATSLDATADIQVLNARVRVNGGEESSYDGKIEACQVCRQRITEQLRNIFTPEGTLSIQVARKGGDAK